METTAVKLPSAPSEIAQWYRVPSLSASPSNRVVSVMLGGPNLESGSPYQILFSLGPTENLPRSASRSDAISRSFACGGRFCRPYAIMWASRFNVSAALVIRACLGWT
jgi:hypothetical protein